MLVRASFLSFQDEEDSFVMKAIIHAINDDNVPGLQHLLGSLSNYDVNQPNKVCVNTSTTANGGEYVHYSYIS